MCRDRCRRCGGRIVERHARITHNHSGRILIQYLVLLHTSLIFTRNLPRLIKKLHPPILCAVLRHKRRRRIHPSVDEIQLNPPFAFPVALLAIVAMRQPLITLEMPLSTSQTPGAHPLWFTRRPFATVIAVAIRHETCLAVSSVPGSDDDALGLFVGLGVGAQWRLLPLAARTTYMRSSGSRSAVAGEYEGGR